MASFEAGRVSLCTVVLQAMRYPFRQTQGLSELLHGSTCESREAGVGKPARPGSSSRTTGCAPRPRRCPQRGELRSSVRSRRWRSRLSAPGSRSSPEPGPTAPGLPPPPQHRPGRAVGPSVPGMKGAAGSRPHPSASPGAEHGSARRPPPALPCPPLRALYKKPPGPGGRGPPGSRRAASGTGRGHHGPVRVGLRQRQW